MRCSEYPGALGQSHALVTPSMPSLSAVSGLSLPSHRWGAGSALTDTARQLSTALGTAVLTMIYQPGIDLTTARHGWEFIAAAATTSALIAAGLGAWWRSGDADQPVGVDDAIVVSET